MNTLETAQQHAKTTQNTNTLANTHNDLALFC